MTEKLIPPDKTRCQAESRKYSFITLGIPSMKRCKNKPSVIITEKKASEGYKKKGSMSLCPECMKAFLEKDNKPVTIKQLNTRRNT